MHRALGRTVGCFWFVALMTGFIYAAVGSHNPRFAVRVVGGANDGMAFVNVDEESSTGSELTLVTKGTKKWDPTCFKCGKKGHIAKDCKEEGGAEETGDNFLMDGVTDGSFDDMERSISAYMFVQGEGGQRINPSWILLDNQSTVDVFSNRKLLQNIRKINSSLKIHCTAGVAR